MMVKKKLYKAIIFDMDGTIIDSNGVWDLAAHRLIMSKVNSLRQQDLDAVNKEIKGLALHASCAIIKNYWQIEDSVDLLIQEKTAHAVSLYKDGIKFIPGFKDFFKEVEKHDLKVAIATNAEDTTLEISTRTMELDNFFGEHIYNITHVNNIYKPFPDIYLHTAKMLGVPPEECIAIEDSTHGVNAAVAAGMFCIGINTNKDREALKNAHMIAENYYDIDLDELLYKKAE